MQDATENIRPLTFSSACADSWKGPSTPIDIRLGGIVIGRIGKALHWTHGEAYRLDIHADGPALLCPDASRPYTRAQGGSVLTRIFKVNRPEDLAYTDKDGVEWVAGPLSQRAVSNRCERLEDVKAFVAKVVRGLTSGPYAPEDYQP